MFLKKLFGKTEEPNPQTSGNLPVNHPKLPPGAAGDKCPFMSKKGGQKAQENDDDEKPRGGCPFMGGKDSQKNPPLQLTNESYDEIFVSKYRFFLSDSKIDFDFMETHKQKRNRSREVFNKYSVYLQHSLFFNSEDYKAVRRLECCSRFMPYEELREKGNKQFNKGNFARSLDFYERAYSLFKWLEHQEPQPIPQSTCQSLMEIESSIDQGDRSKIELNIDSETEREIPKKPVDDDFKKQHKQFFVLYCDQNTKLYDGQEMSETYDTDMRKSLMVQILLNLASSYIMLSNYSLAYVCCSEAEMLTEKMSQIQYRKAQSIVYNKSASLEKLQEAKQLIQTALRKRKYEKIFNETNPNILKMLNLHDSEQAYTRCLEKVDVRIQEVKNLIQQKQTRLFERAAQIHRAQLDIMSRGMTPHERMIEGSIHDTVEFRVVERMKQKYLRVIDFYTESEKPEQIQAAKRQLQEVLRVSYEMMVIANINIDRCPDGLDLGDKDSEKVIKRIEKVKLEQCQDHYNKARYNFQMLEWAIKEIVEEDEKKRVALQKKEQQAEGTVNKIQSKQNYLWFLLLLPVLAIIGSRFILN